MFYSHTNDEIKIDFFLNLLSQLNSGQQLHEKPYLDAIIKDVHDLAVGIKSYYTIDRDGYPISISLFEADKDFFAKLDIDNLSASDYKKVFDLLFSQRELVTQ